jgi:hypothetical protein
MFAEGEAGDACKAGDAMLLVLKVEVLTTAGGLGMDARTMLLETCGVVLAAVVVETPGLLASDAE